MKIKALIAVRSGSQRVENKNIRKFADSNLLTIKIEQLKRIELLEGIVVNSNCPEMIHISKELGVDTVKRDDYYASNIVSMSDVYKNMAENFPGEYILYANVTNPLMKDDTIRKAITVFRQNASEYDSLNSAHLIKEFLFFENKPMNYDLLKQPRSQDLPDIYALNFAVSIISRENMIKYKNVIGGRPYIFNVDYYEATDIDHEIDFEIAEYLYIHRGHQNSL